MVKYAKEAENATKSAKVRRLLLRRRGGVGMSQLCLRRAAQDQQRPQMLDTCQAAAEAMRRAAASTLCWRPHAPMQQDTQRSGRMAQ